MVGGGKLNDVDKEGKPKKILNIKEKYSRPQIMKMMKTMMIMMVIKANQ